MKTNPLNLGISRLHAAVNLAFNEGGIKTRPCFNYTSLGSGALGQFQGACEFALNEGISSESFGSAEGLALVVAGRIKINSTLLSTLYTGDGDVNIFDAENYLVFHNKNTNTYWWDGTSLTQSKGHITHQWEDLETDFDDVKIDTPVADIPDCDSNDVNLSRNLLRFVNVDTNQRLEGVDFEVTYNKNLAHKGTSDENGQHQLYPVPRRYRLNTSYSGYVSKVQQPLDLRTSGLRIISLMPITKQCGELIESAGFREERYAIELGNEVGTIQVDFDFKATPGRIKIEYDDKQVLDTGYRGEIEYDSDLRDDGYSGIVGNPTGTVYFNKKTPFPNYAIFTVYKPIGVIDWDVQFSCPNGTFTVLDPDPNPPDDTIIIPDPIDPIGKPVVSGTIGPVGDGYGPGVPTIIDYPLAWFCETDERFVMYRVWGSAESWEPIWSEDWMTELLPGPITPVLLYEFTSPPGLITDEFSFPYQHEVTVPTVWTGERRNTSVFWVEHITTEGSVNSDYSFIYQTGA